MLVLPVCVQVATDNLRRPRCVSTQCVRESNIVHVLWAIMVCEKAVEVFTVISPIGEMIMKICPQGLHSLSQSDYICDTNFHPQER